MEARSHRSTRGWKWFSAHRDPGPCLRAPAERRAFTLIEALVASVIVTMVAGTAAMSVAVGAAIESQNRLSVLAMQAAELRLGELLELPYDGMSALAGTEAPGMLRAPSRPGAAGAAGPVLPDSFASLSRTTAVTDEDRAFPALNNHVVRGKRIEVTVAGPDGSTLARLVRFRGKDPTT